MLTIGEGGPLQAPFGLVIGQGGPDGELRSKRSGDGGHPTLDSSWWFVGGHRNLRGGGAFKMTGLCIRSADCLDGATSLGACRAAPVGFAPEIEVPKKISRLT